MRIAAWSVFPIAVALAGCGGQSANEQRARWVRDADAACAKAERAIAARGAPRAGTGYVRDVPAAARDVRAAIRDVLALDPPEHERSVQYARGALKAVDADLAPLAGVSETTTPEAVVEMIDELQDSAEDVDEPARAGGLRTCGRAEARDAALDALKGPVFAIQLDAYAGAFVRNLESLRESATSDPR